MPEFSMRPRLGGLGYGLVLAGWVLACCCGLAIAQEAPVMIATPDGKPPTPEQMKAIEEAQRRGRGKPGAEPPQPSKEEKKEEKKEGEGEGKEKKSEGSDSIKRPEKPPRVPDARELEVALDKNGHVPPFNFIGQPWPDVMQWLANLSRASLDWQELPNDYVNLMTDRAKSIDEVRDDINRLLHARGYTSVQTGDSLSVFKIEKLDPSVIKRVAEDELYDRKPYDFVKVSFELPPGMEVDKAKDDIKQVLSPNARIFPLPATKRILVIDAVTNLRDVSSLLNEERMVQDGRIVPKEFVLKHARPEQVIDILYVVLGMDPKSRPTQMDLQLQQQKLQLMQQMQQRGTDVSKMLKQEGPPVYLAYNKQRNSVLVNAPPEQMRIIEQTIAYLDVPFGSDGSVGAATGEAPSAGKREMRKYPLTTLDPENFVHTLEQIGGLSPYAEFKFDKKSKLLFALATDTDHTKIKGLIADFDGTGRDFWVIQLRRLPADAVAASIFNLMGGQTKEDSNNNRRRYWSPWDDYGRDEEEDKPVKGFGVDADVENNRLLLWANDAEMERVRGLLVKLGEIPEGQDQRAVRFVQPSSDIPATELLDRIREAWGASGQSELIINVPQKPADNKSEKKEVPQNKPQEPGKDRSAAAAPQARVPAHYVQTQLRLAADSTTGAAGAEALDSNEPASQEKQTPTTAGSRPAQAPPVTITVTEDGRLMISSKDPVLLDRMEDLIDQLSPPEKRFKVYRLKYITALNMKWTLEDFFKEELDAKESTGDPFDFFFWPPRSRGGDKKGGSGLSRRPKLVISWDTPSNTIMVANASPSQQKEIEQLIDEYDRPAPADSQRTRRTAAIKVQYSKASTIADAIKEVYRDLLSSRDKEFDRGGDKQRGQTTERVTVFRYGATGGDDSSQRPTPMKVGFEGALSIGVDDVANMIIISAQEELFPSVEAMIHRLDEEAAPKTTVHVHRVTGSVTAEALQKAIDKAMSKPWPGGRPEQDAGQGGRGKGDGGERRRGEGDDRGRDRRNGDRDNNND